MKYSAPKSRKARGGSNKRGRDRQALLAEAMEVCFCSRKKI